MNNEQNNNNDDDDNQNTVEIRKLIVEIFWLASLASSSTSGAVRNRRLALTHICEILDSQEGEGRNLEHAHIYGIMMSLGGATFRELRGGFVHRLLHALNNRTQRRVFRRLVERILSAGRPISYVFAGGNTEEDISDVTFDVDGHVARPLQRPLHGAQFDLRALGEALPDSNGASAEDRGAVQNTGDIGLHISGSGSQRTTISQRFRRGEYDALQQLSIDQIFQALSPLPTLEALATQESSTANLSAQPREGDEDTFQNNDQDGDGQGDGE